jgi:hypothetical protein
MNSIRVTLEATLEPESCLLTTIYWRFETTYMRTIDVFTVRVRMTRIRDCK